MAGTVVRYSEAFKQQVVSAVESGRFGSPFEAATVYGIGNGATVSRWLQQYGRGRLLKKVVRVQSTEEVDEVRRLRRQVRELKEALADAHLAEDLNRAYLELLSEQAGVDLDHFRKKKRWDAAHRAASDTRRQRGVTVEGLCRMTGMTRQNFYRRRQQRQVQSIEEELVLALVRRERQQQPRLGTRKLLWILGPELADADVKLGRDQLFALLRRHDLLLERLPGTPRTTQSRHPLPVFHNLVRDREDKAPNQTWVADLTYVRTDAGFVYVALITDRYSRKIVGWYCGDSLESFGCVEALKMALKDLPADAHPVHHSDRGCQYCCHEYVQCLQDRQLPISMTEQNHCYENAHAERINGILKQEYALGMTLRTKADARRAVEQAVWLYNHRRPHLSLGFRTPAHVHSLAA